MVAEPLSPELALVLPAEERREVLAALPEPSHAGAPALDRTRLSDGETQRDEHFSGPRLIAAAGAYALVRFAAAIPYYAVTVVPIVFLLLILGLLR